MATEYEKATVITVRTPEVKQRPVTSTGAPAQTDQRPRHEKKNDRKPARQLQQFQQFQTTPAKPAPVAVPKGKLGDLIALAKTTLTPGNVSTLEEMGARFKAKKDETALGLAATIQALVAKAGAGTTGPSAELTAAAEAVANNAKAIETVNATLAAADQAEVASAVVVIALLALTERDAKVRSKGANYAGLCGKCNRASDEEKPALEAQKTAMKDEIDKEKAAIAAARAEFSEETRDAALAKHEAATPEFTSLVTVVTERDQLSAKQAELTAEHDRLAAEGPGLVDNLAKAIAAYQTRLQELSQTK
jgi:hypothetical protein